MKIKGINPLELHVEKIALALAAIALLAVFALQFVGGGSTVTVENREVAVDQAFEELARRAEAVQGQIEAESVDERAPQSTPDLASSFEELLTSPVVRDLRLAGPLGRSIESVGEGRRLTGESLRVRMPDVPAPRDPIGVSFAGAIDPLVVAAYPELRDAAPHLPDQQPYDLRSVTVEATFDASELIADLKADPDGAGPMQSIPLFWWQNTLAILDVELWRQELLPSGEYGQPELAPALPGRLSYRDRLDEIETLPQLRTIASDARDRVRDLIMPRYYRLIAGEPWTPPSIMRESAGQAGRIQQLRRQYSNTTREIEEIQAQLGGASQRPGSRQSRIDAPVGRYVAQDRFQPGGGGQDSSDTRRDERQREQTRINALQGRLEDLRNQRETIAAELQGLGVDVEGERLRNPVDEILAEPIGRLRDGPSLRIWSHDIAPEPGRTYRYQMRLVLANPLYGYEQNLDADSKSLAAAPTIASEPSQWSEFISVDNNSYLFITEASISPGLGGVGRVATARVELYRFYYGFWRRAVATLRPGDAVTGSLDLSELALPEFEIAEPEGEVAPRVEEQRPQSGEFAFNAEGWFLLDVTPTSTANAAGREMHQAVLRAPSGDLLARTPAADAASDRRSRLSVSAEAGLGAVVRPPDLGADGGGAVGDGRRPGPRESRPERDRSNDGLGRRFGG